MTHEYLDSIGLDICIDGHLNRGDFPCIYPWLEAWTKTMMEYIPAKYQATLTCYESRERVYKFPMPDQISQAFDRLRDPSTTIFFVSPVEAHAMALPHVKPANSLYMACQAAATSFDEAACDKQAMYDYCFGQNGTIEHAIIPWSCSHFNPACSPSAPPYVHFVFFDEKVRSRNPAKWNTLYFKMSVVWPRFLFPDGFPLEVQKQCVETVETLCSQLPDANGTITTDTYNKGFWDIEGKTRSFPCWGNCLKKVHVDAIGGVDAIRDHLDCEELKVLPGGKVFYTLSPDVNNFDRKRIRSARAVLKPCSGPPLDWLSAHQYQYIMRLSYEPEELELYLFRHHKWFFREL